MSLSNSFQLPILVNRIIVFILMSMHTCNMPTHPQALRRRFLNQ